MLRQYTVLLLVNVIFLSFLLNLTNAVVDINETMLNEMLQQDLNFCEGKYDDEDCALRWANERSTILKFVYNAIAQLEFENQVNSTQFYIDKLTDLSVEASIKYISVDEQAKKFNYEEFKDETTKRRFKLITDSFKTNNQEIIQLIEEIKQKMTWLYTTARACYSPNNCLDSGEETVNEVFKTERDYNKLLALWDSWQNSSGYTVKPYYISLVKLSNIGARENGYRDAAYAEWLLNFESSTFDSDVVNLFNETKDLYDQLHAYVRHKLLQIYPGKFKDDGCLPAHILGNIWAQEWHLPDETYPYPKEGEFELETLMHTRYNSFDEIVKEAETFFVSLGLHNMTSDFWNKSSFYKPTDPNIIKDCHGTAYDLYDGKDFRISMCGGVNAEDFYTIHHEMGHIQYDMAYKDQPHEFQNSANDGFHEAVGDTISLSVSSFTHLKYLQLTELSSLPDELNINMQFEMALKKLPFLAFSLALDVFRWNVYNGTIPMSDLNEGWWKIRSGFGGICPPNTRPQDGFDAGSKYHVANDISYIRYFVSEILQFQFYDTLCKESGYQGDLNQCDFFNSKEAGKKFWQMLTVGRSRFWEETLQDFSGHAKMSTEPIYEYFKPLYTWLKDYNKKNNIPVGWKLPNDILEGVTL